jgi:hypothetical protein
MTTAELARIEDRLRRAYHDAAETLGDGLVPERMRTVGHPVRRIRKLGLAGNAAVRVPLRALVVALGSAGGGLQPRYLMAEGVVGQLQARMR